VSVVFGKKRYEISDWLGNVRVVINDRKTPVNIGTTTVGYKAQVVNVNDYYSYGSTINERTYDYSSTKFRFAFNGKELDNEVYGFGNFQDYGARMYNTRLGRFISADPIIVFQKRYTWLSSYQFASDNPIKYIDFDGLEGIDVMKEKAREQITKDLKKYKDKFIGDIEQLSPSSRKFDSKSRATSYPLKIRYIEHKQLGPIEPPKTKDLSLDISREEDRINGRVNIVINEENVNRGVLNIQYNSTLENNDKPTEGFIEVGIVNTEGQEIPLIKEEIKNAKGEIKVEFKLNENENLYYRSEGNYNLEIKAMKESDNNKNNNEKNDKNKDE
jgi:RHS repeat-associated protein